MKIAMITLLSGLLLAAEPASVGPALAQGEDCLSNQQIQRAIADGDVAPLAEVLKGAGIGADAEILSVKVCRQGREYTYVVAVLGRDGNARNLNLPAGN